jgi:hypothetical protein
MTTTLIIHASNVFKAGYLRGKKFHELRFYRLELQDVFH